MEDKHQLMLVIHGDPMDLIRVQQYLSQLIMDDNGGMLPVVIRKMEIKPVTE